MLIGAFLRLYRFEEFITFLGDQGRDAIIIKRIVTLEHFPAIGPVSSVGQVFLGPFFYYLKAPFLFLFHFNPLGLAFGSFFYSLIGTVFVYLIIKKKDKITAKVLLIFLTFSLVFIHNSRYSWNPNLLPFFSFFTLYFFSNFYQNSLIYSFFAGAFFSFSIQLHYLAFLLIPAIAVFLIINLKNNSFKKLIRNLLISLSGFIIFYSPLILFDLKNNFLNTKNFINLFTKQKFVESTSLSSRLNETLINFFDHSLNLKLNYSIITLGLIVLFIFFFKKKFFSKNLLFQINFLNFFLYLISFSLLNSFRYYHYYASVYLSFYLVLSIFLASIYKKNFLNRILVVVLIFFFIFQNQKKYYFFWVKEGNFQTRIAKKIAQSILDNNPQIPYQIVPIPFTEMDGHIRYYLEIAGKRPLSEESSLEGKELYVLCYEKECEVLNHPQWQIAAFSNKKIAKIWKVDRVKIYKLIHGK